MNIWEISDLHSNKSRERITMEVEGPYKIKMGIFEK